MKDKQAERRKLKRIRDAKIARQLKRIEEEQKQGLLSIQTAQTRGE